MWARPVLSCVPRRRMSGAMCPCWHGRDACADVLRRSLNSTRRERSVTKYRMCCVLVWEQRCQASDGALCVGPTLCLACVPRFRIRGLYCARRVATQGVACSRALCCGMHSSTCLAWHVGALVAPGFFRAAVDAARRCHPANSLPLSAACCRATQRGVRDDTWVVPGA